MRFLKSLQRNEFQRRDEPAPIKATNGQKLDGVFTNRKLRISVSADVVERAPNVLVERVEAAFDPAVTDGPDAETIGRPHATEKPHATLTIDPASVNPRLVAITQPASAYSEEYRSLRTQLIHKKKEKELRSIAIVSIGPSEGKSITALNLSWLLAQTDGMSVLVIDGDMRRPSVASYLGVECRTGLSDILAGSVSMTEALLRLDPAGLCVIAAGQPRDDVAELLAGPKFDDLLKEAYETFDVVIIDAPPFGLFSEAAVLVNCADGALLVVRADQVSYKEANRIMETLPHERFLGIVLNQSKDGFISRRYYKHSYYEKY